MNIQERIEHAEKRKNEAFSKESLCDMNYWIGYLNALKACSEEYHNLEQSRDYWKAKAEKAQKNLRIMRKNREIFDALKSAGIDEWRYPVIAEIKKKFLEDEG